MILTLSAIYVVILLWKLTIVISRKDIVARRNVSQNKYRMISLMNGLNVLILIIKFINIVTKKCKAHLIKFHVN